MEKKRIRAVLWDMDGTLFNTKRGIEKAVRGAAEEMGLPILPTEVVDGFIGPPIQYGFRDIYGLSQEDALKAADIFRAYYRDKNYVLECDPYPGLFDSLKALKEMGLSLAVCTLKKQDMAERIVRDNGLSDLFDSVIGTDARDSIKKHDTIRLTCEKFGIQAEEAVLAGDTEYDALGAEKAGCLFIGVTFGFGFKTKEEVDQYPNIGTASSTEEIAEIVRNYSLQEF